ncbi:hypothetical protein V2J09_021951 [Rumex salicifolius]
MMISNEVSIYTIFAQFRGGFQKIQRIGWVSPSALHVSVVGVLGFACSLILTLRGVRMGSSHSLSCSSEGGDSSIKITFVPGLRNLGNNCFLNAILQALASCSSFHLFLEENVEGLISEPSFTEEQIERLPLSAALIALFGDLCVPQNRRAVLNPRSVMSAMYLYMPQFQLISQQDAAEAFLHLLSCVREEFSESYIPNHGSLADLGNIATASGRIVTQKRIQDASELKKWKQRFIGPFDGILSSFLICQSCSSEVECLLYIFVSILLDYDFFHTLSLSPVVDACAFIVDKCSLEDCLKRFMAAETVENYHCTHCWHLAAMKYLSLSEGYEAEMRKLRCCSKQDSCNCRNQPCLQGLQWSDRFSRTVKQLSVVRCPKILCLQIQRSSVNIYGELVKNQGHISFPMILDVSPFVNAGVGMRKVQDEMPRPLKQHCDQSIFDFTNMQTGNMLNLISGLTGDNKLFGAVGNHRLEGCCEVNLNNKSQEKVPSHSNSSDNNLTYRLVSVVVHFGRSGSGHYTVYRGAKLNLVTDQDTSQLTNPPMQWFSVSDSVVHPVSEDEVLAADATLLFYERIIEA